MQEKPIVQFPCFAYKRRTDDLIQTFTFIFFQYSDDSKSLKDIVQVYK